MLYNHGESYSFHSVIVEVGSMQGKLLVVLIMLITVGWCYLLTFPGLARNCPQSTCGV